MAVFLHKFKLGRNTAILFMNEYFSFYKSIEMKFLSVDGTTSTN